MPLKIIDLSKWAEFLEENIGESANLDGTDRYDNGFADGMDAADEWIDAQPTVEAPQWISVTERLPEPDDLVLAYCPVRKETPSEVVMRGWAAMIHATHWMPLPSAPEVE